MPTKLQATLQTIYASPEQGTSTHPLETLLHLWRSGDITVEQLAGHLLQHLIAQEKRLLVLERGAKLPSK